MKTVHKMLNTKRVWLYLTFTVIIFCLANAISGLSMVGKTFQGFGTEFSLTVTRTISLEHWTGSKADFEEYATITAVNSNPVSNIKQFKAIIGNISPGSEVEYTYLNPFKDLENTAKVKTMVFSFYDYYSTFLLYCFISIIFSIFNLFLLGHLGKSNFIPFLLFFNFAFSMGFGFQTQYDFLHNLPEVGLLAPSLIVIAVLSLGIKIDRENLSKKLLNVSSIILLTAFFNVFFLLSVFFIIKDNLFENLLLYSLFIYSYFILITLLAVSFLSFPAFVLHCYLKTPPDKPERRISRIILTGTLLALMPYFILFFMPVILTGKILSESGITYISFVLIPFFISYAVIKYKAFDIEVYIRKGLIYTLLTTIVFLSYLILSFVLSIALDSLIAINEKAVIMVSAFFSFFITDKLKDKIQNLVDSAFYRQKNDLGLILENFRYDIKDIIEKNQLAEKACHYLERAFNPEFITLYIKKDDKYILLRSVNSKNPEVASFQQLLNLFASNMQVIIKKENIITGFLIIGAKKSETEYSNEEKQFLDIFSGIFSVYLNVALLSEEYITAKVKNKELETKTSFLTEITGNLSHDLKAPVSSCYSLAEKILLLMQMKPDLTGVEIRKNSNKLIKALKKVNEYISISLDKEMLTAGKLNLRLETVNVKEFYGELASLYSELIEKKGLSFLTGCSAGDSFIEADRIRLEHVISNILGNAAKFADTFIQADVYKQNELVVIKITNDGPEIPPELKENLFERYITGSPVSDSGTGIGLYISKKYIEFMGGRIWFESAKNQTSFFISLPETKSIIKVESDIVESL